MTDRDTWNLNPDEGCVMLHSGATIFWRRNAAGGRAYSSDEIGGGVEVWDTCLVAPSTLCEAMAIETALASAELRAPERRGELEPGFEHGAVQAIQTAADKHCGLDFPDFPRVGGVRGGRET